MNTPGGRRIFGIENEYGITCSTGGQRTLTPDEVARYLFRKVVAWGRSSNVFLTNGSRLYLDVGSHPEYATAECDSLRQLVAHDKAGERIIEGLVVDAQQRLREDGVAGDIYVFKNNTDSAGNSYGCHENYLVTRAGEFSTISDTLLPFLISRQITCGAGKLVATSKGATYAVSQRADHIWEGVSSATTRSRPIINTRDEPHADAEHYRRLHVIVGDSNMSESTTMLKVGSCDLVLRMIEAGVVMRDLTLENPIRAIREISHDITGRSTVRLANGRQLCALDMQREYLSKATEFVAREGSTDPLHEQVLDLWDRTLTAVETGDLALVGTEIDWVIKHRLLDATPRSTGCRSTTRGSRRSTSPTTTSTAAAGCSTCSSGAAGSPGSSPTPRSSRPRCPAADHPRQAARRLHPGRPGAPARLHGRLGAPQAQRPGPAHGPVQGPVPRPGPPGRAAHRGHDRLTAQGCTCRVLPAGDAGVHTGRRYRGLLLSAARQRPTTQRFTHVSRRLATALVRHGPRLQPSCSSACGDEEAAKPSAAISAVTVNGSDPKAAPTVTVKSSP